MYPYQREAPAIVAELTWMLACSDREFGKPEDFGDYRRVDLGLLRSTSSRRPNSTTSSVRASIGG